MILEKCTEQPFTLNLLCNRKRLSQAFHNPVNKFNLNISDQLSGFVFHVRFIFTCFFNTKKN